MAKYQNQQQQQAWDKEWEELTGNTSDVPSMYEHFGSYGNLRLRERPGAMRRAGGSELEREAEEYRDATSRYWKQQQQPKLPNEFSNIHPMAMNRGQLNQYRQMRNTSLIPRGATNTPYNTQNTFKPMNPMAFLDNYNSPASPTMQNPFQF